MTDPLVLPTRAQHSPVRTRRRRRLAALAVAGLAGAALSPAVAALPAAAASPCALPAFSATATADLIRLDLLDLHALGRPDTLANVRIASTSAGVTGGASAKSAAQARYLDAKLLGLPVPAGALTATAHQEAPPAHGAAVTTRAAATDLGALALGTGTLTAGTPWPGPEACAPPTGTEAHASASLLQATVLPNNGGGLVQVPHNLASDTSTELVQHHPQATASASLADFTLFAGTPGKLRVQVISQPKLRVQATGSAAHAVVEYTAPVLTVTMPNGTSRTLDSPAHGLEMAVPPSGGSAAGGSASAEGSAEGGGTGTASSLPVLGLLGGLVGTTPHEEASTAAALVVRLSLGELHKKVTGDKVRADAASLRVQVVARTTTKAKSSGGYGGGYGGGVGGVSGETTVVDFGVGVLGAEASTPGGTGGVTGGGGGTGGGTTGGGTGAGGSGGVAAAPPPGGRLPTTGGNVAWILSGGTVLLVAGRFLMLVTRRRFFA
jgi:hypothetical protein